MAAPDTIIIKFDPDDRALIERLVVALEALIKQQKIAPPPSDTPRIGPFLGEE